MNNIIKQICVLCLMVLAYCGSFAQTRHSKTSLFTTYKGKIMAGYQGWFNTPTDGANRGWRHYQGRNGFKPGSITDDLWPDVSEYKKVYPTPFKHADSTTAYLPSPYDYSTVDVQLKWMKDYGLDGVFVQRFIVDVRDANGLAGTDQVLQNALKAAGKYKRALSLMYDFSGMDDSGADKVIADWKHLVDDLKLTAGGNKQPYLYHNGKPLVALWGVGFNDGRRYHLAAVEKIMEFLQHDPVYGGCSILLGVPTYWRDFGNDTEKDPHLHDVLKKADIIHPWMVGRYNEDGYPKFEARLKDDIAWCKENKLDYVPVVFPGFSWHNMNVGRRTTGTIPPQNQIPRTRGQFFWKQLTGAIKAGAEMIYVAMFDEIDEGTAIFKIDKNPPVGLSTFVTFEDDIPNDYYLYLAGYAGRVLRKEVPMPAQTPLPKKK